VHELDYKTSEATCTVQHKKNKKEPRILINIDQTSREPIILNSFSLNLSPFFDIREYKPMCLDIRAVRV
jgi:hypothetical protein